MYGKRLQAPECCSSRHSTLSLNLNSFPTQKEMLPRLEHFHRIPNTHNSLLQRRNLHAQARILTSLIDDPITPQRTQRLIAIHFSSIRVHVG
jgi:hypothetical protein